MIIAQCSCNQLNSRKQLVCIRAEQTLSSKFQENKTSHFKSRNQNQNINQLKNFDRRKKLRFTRISQHEVDHSDLLKLIRKNYFKFQRIGQSTDYRIVLTNLIKIFSLGKVSHLSSEECVELLSMLVEMNAFERRGRAKLLAEHVLIHYRKTQKNNIPQNHIGQLLLAMCKSDRIDELLFQQIKVKLFSNFEFSDPDNFVKAIESQVHEKLFDNLIIKKSLNLLRNNKNNNTSNCYKISSDKVNFEQNNSDIYSNDDKNNINNNIQIVSEQNCVDSSNNNFKVQNIDSFSLVQIIRIFYALVSCNISDIKLNNYFLEKIALNQEKIEIDPLNAAKILQIIAFYGRRQYNKNRMIEIWQIVLYCLKKVLNYSDNSFIQVRALYAVAIFRIQFEDILDLPSKDQQRSILKYMFQIADEKIGPLPPQISPSLQNNQDFLQGNNKKQKNVLQTKIQKLKLDKKLTKLIQKISEKIGQKKFLSEECLTDLASVFVLFRVQGIDLKIKQGFKHKLYPKEIIPVIKRKTKIRDDVIQFLDRLGYNNVSECMCVLPEMLYVDLCVFVGTKAVVFLDMTGGYFFQMGAQTGKGIVSEFLVKTVGWKFVYFPFKEWNKMGVTFQQKEEILKQLLDQIL